MTDNQPSNLDQQFDDHRSMRAAPEAAALIETGWCDVERLKPHYHEAGHAVVATLTGFKVAWVSVDEHFIRRDALAISNGCAAGALSA